MSFCGDDDKCCCDRIIRAMSRCANTIFIYFRRPCQSFNVCTANIQDYGAVFVLIKVPPSTTKYFNSIILNLVVIFRETMWIMGCCCMHYKLMCMFWEIFYDYRLRCKLAQYKLLFVKCKCHIFPHIQIDKFA